TVDVVDRISRIDRSLWSRVGALRVRRSPIWTFRASSIETGSGAAGILTLRNREKYARLNYGLASDLPPSHHRFGERRIDHSAEGGVAGDRKVYPMGSYIPAIASIAGGLSDDWPSTTTAGAILPGLIVARLRDALCKCGIATH